MFLCILWDRTRGLRSLWNSPSRIKGPGFPRTPDSECLTLLPAGRSPSRDSGGFGLGLPIAKWAVEVHGTINVKTSSPTGANFLYQTTGRYRDKHLITAIQHPRSHFYQEFQICQGTTLEKFS
jgi:hypothetical protein